MKRWTHLAGGLLLLSLLALACRLPSPFAPASSLELTPSPSSLVPTPTPPPAVISAQDMAELRRAVRRDGRVAHQADDRVREQGVRVQATRGRAG